MAFASHSRLWNSPERPAKLQLIAWEACESEIMMITTRNSNGWRGFRGCLTSSLGEHLQSFNSFDGIMFAD